MGRLQQGPDRPRRLAECAAFVGAWVAVGLALRLEANVYLLLGLPLTAGFQHFVRRQPLHRLWVRDARVYRMSRPANTLAVVLALFPAYLLASEVQQGGSLVLVAYFLAAMGGAVGVAFSVQHVRPDTGRWLLACLATAGGLALVMMLLGVLGPMVSRPPEEALSIGLRSFLMYLPAVFVIEEVTFRGALDAHAHHPGESHNVASAVFVSALWGLWHLPIAHAGNPLGTVGQLLLLHVPVGVFLSVGWRRSGNLLVPGVTHAAIDAVRNALCSTIL